MALSETEQGHPLVREIEVVKSDQTASESLECKLR